MHRSGYLKTTGIMNLRGTSINLWRVAKPPAITPITPEAEGQKFGFFEVLYG